MVLAILVYSRIQGIEFHMSFSSAYCSHCACWTLSIVPPALFLVLAVIFFTWPTREMYIQGGCSVVVAVVWISLALLLYWARRQSCATTMTSREMAETRPSRRMYNNDPEIMAAMTGMPESAAILDQNYPEQEQEQEETTIVAQMERAPECPNLVCGVSSMGIGRRPVEDVLRPYELKFKNGKTVTVIADIGVGRY